MGRSDFPAFLNAMTGLRLLHMGHRDADCDALGSAYAMSRVSAIVRGIICEFNRISQTYPHPMGCIYMYFQRREYLRNG